MSALVGFNVSSTDHLLSPIAASDIKIGMYILLKDSPCKIVECLHSKTGKHGSLKCHFVGIHAVTGKKIVDIEPGHAPMLACQTSKCEGTVLGMTDTSMDLLTDDNQSVTVELEGMEETLTRLKEDYHFNKDQDVVVQLLFVPSKTILHQVVTGHRVTPY